MAETPAQAEAKIETFPALRPPLMSYLASERARYYASEEWRQKRMQCFIMWNWKCCVCDHDYRKRGEFLQAHHLPDGYKHFGKEDVRRHLRPLCTTHHKKGQMSLTVIRQMRSAYRFQKAVNAVCSWLWAGLKGILRLLWKGVKWVAQPPRKVPAGATGGPV